MHTPRATARDFRSHLIERSLQNTVDDALWQPLDKEEELLELVILQVCNRPDCQFSTNPQDKYSTTLRN